MIKRIPKRKGNWKSERRPGTELAPGQLLLNDRVQFLQLVGVKPLCTPANAIGSVEQHQRRKGVNGELRFYRAGRSAAQEQAIIDSHPVPDTGYFADLFL